MQYKIIHGIYTCNLKLYQWKIKPSSVCNYCEEIDNDTHHFYFCRDMAIFWNSFINWWYHICTNCITNKVLTLTQVMLGVKEKVCHKPQLNFLIYLAKWYIFRSKYLEQKCFFVDYLTEVKNNLEIERVIQITNGKLLKYIEMWQVIYNSL